MALHCIARNFPRYMQVSSKYYFSGISLARSASVVGSTKLINSKIEPYSAACNTALKLSPSAINKTINLTQVKEFSVTSSNQAAAGHDHTKLWNAERVVSAALLGIVPVAFVFPSQVMDTLLAITVVMHNHWGIEAIVIDYVRPSIFGSVIPKVTLGLTYALSIATLVGLFYLIFNSSGLVNTIQLFWRV